MQWFRGLLRRAPRTPAWVIALLAVPCLLPSVSAQRPDADPQLAEAAPPVAPESDAEDRGWPRQFEAQGHKVRVYAPQVDEWPDFDRITFRAAISVAPSDSQDRVYGILRVSASTKVAFDERLVVLTDRKVEELTFPDVAAEEASRLSAVVLAAMPPERPQTVSLDRVIAGMKPAEANVRKVEVNTAPPRIITSEKPAVLVIFMGKPRFKPVPESELLFAINTNWDVFLEPTEKKYYLRNDHSWLVAMDVETGPWVPARQLPPSLSKLPADENWNDVREAIPGTPSAEVPIVYVTNEPAELLVTDGAPELEVIPGTALMVVANTESHLFYNTADKQYYLLAAGRWFKATALAGPWAAASGSLPEDFKKIPESETTADVLASVPGTAAANEAVILASIPQKATINRSEVTVNVTYDGTPVFKPIESTTVEYAYNSPFNVFLVDGRYYCCHNAVWFEAPTATGVWVVCVSVPKAIYTIPPTSPKYNVTYVTVYESTPTTVVTGYTSGYSGATVAATGVVMFGLGLLVGEALDDDWSSYHYHSCFYSYGCGAVYHGGCGGYVCGSRHYGPYGGAGRAAAYNPSTGVYSRAGYAYGPNGAAGYRTAYNPATGTSAARAGGTNAYGSWGSSAVTNGDQWVRGSHNTTARGTTGSIQSSSGAAAATAQGRYGNGVTVARSSDGDYYASKNGNVYQKGDNGWQPAGSASSAARAAPPPGANPPAGQPRAQPSSGGTTPSRPGGASADGRSATVPSQTQTELQQHATTRDRGERNTERARDTRSQSGGGRSRSTGGRGGGGGGRGRR